MKVLIRSIYTIIFGACFIMLFNVGDAHAQFEDVPVSHQFYDAIIWAKNEGIIDGYSDGNFKPSGQLTEAQFAKIVSNYFRLEPVEETIKKIAFFGPADGAHWADAYYARLASYSATILKYHGNEGRDQPVKRGHVAFTLAHFTGTPTTSDESIQFLVDNGITTGQN